MDTYAEGQKCPKCGSTNITVEFEDGDATANPIKPEVIKITCKNCEFEGDMAPLDTPPE